MEKLPSTSGVQTSSVSKRSRVSNDSDDACPKKPKIVIDPLQLVDVNDDCLEAIFKHLALADLFNVCESHERFVVAAQTLYSRRYRSKSITVDVTTTGISAEDGFDDIEIGMDISEAFLRYFGHMISSLWFNSKNQLALNIEMSLFKHCTESLASLDLYSCNVKNFETINEPLKKVENLAISNSFLGKNLSMLNIWFPSITSLRLDQSGMAEPKALEVNFADLKHLEIYNNGRDLTEATIGKLLRFNQQLESLVLCCEINADFLRFIAEHTPQVEELELWVPSDRFNSFGDQKITFESVKEFKLNCWHHYGLWLAHVPFKFTELQKLWLHGFNEFNNQMLEFIKQNKGISNLYLVPYIDNEDDFGYWDDWEHLTFDDLQSIVETLSKLVELEFCAETFTDDELARLLLENMGLKKVRIWFIERLECFCHIRKAVEAQWVITIPSNGTCFAKMIQLERVN